MWPFGNLEELKTKVKVAVMGVISMKCIDWALILGAIWILYQQNLKLQEILDRSHIAVLFEKLSVVNAIKFSKTLQHQRPTDRKG